MRKFLLRLAGATIAASIASVPVSAITAPTITAPRPVDQFAVLSPIDGPRLSPNGNLLAAKVAVRGEPYLMIIPMDGGAPRIVATGDNDLNYWRWVNNGWLVVGIGSMAPFGINGEAYVQRALGVSADGKTISPLLHKKRDIAQNGSDLVWIANDGTPRVKIAVQRSIYYEEPGFWPEVYEVDVSNDRSSLDVASREGVLDWIADGSGTVRAGVGRNIRSEGGRVLYRSSANNDFREIAHSSTAAESLVVPVLFTGGDKAIAIRDDADGFSSVYEYDLTNLKQGTMVAASKGYDIGGIKSDRSGNKLAGVIRAEGAVSTEWIDPSMRALQAEINSKVRGGNGSIVSYSDDLNRAVVLFGAADSPGAYFLYDRASGAMTRLGYVNPAIEMSKLHPVRTVTYTARDGLPIGAVLTLPRGKMKNLPLIVLPHGGPSARDYEDWDWWTQFLADRGYAVIQPNYRGSSGLGTSFSEKGEGQWGLKMQDDLIDAIAFLSKQGIADSKRVCIAGASYGGYAAIRAAQRDAVNYRCAISYAGVSDLNKLSRMQYGDLFGSKKGNWLKKQAPDFRSVSPINAPQQISIPILLVHGKRDTRVAVSHSREMASKLQAAGKDVTYIEQPKADHFFSRSEDRLEFLKAMEAFLAKHNPA
ncbi:MAG: S9 family peptidase [Sphingomonas bacterium]|nr:S9 family peptidase [Sphingomonas bacterium]